MISVNIFTPVYYRYDATKKSLESIIRHLNSSVYPCKLLIGVNGSESEEMTAWLKLLVSDKIKLYFSNKNIGKAALVNYMYAQNKDSTHIISVDSDMIADEELNFIDSMVWAIEHFNRFGLLSAFQKENDQHLWQYANGLYLEEKKEKFTVKYGNKNCIAGGCIILKKEIWESIKGYNSYGKVYGFDDALMMLAITNIGKEVGVLIETKLTHPNDTDNGYKEWKSNNIRSRSEKGYYEQ